MSDREKKLIAFFVLAGFVVFNFLVFNFAKSKRQQVDARRTQAQQALDTAEVFRASSEQVTDQMNWLAQHEPEPKANQDVQSTLQLFIEREAKATGLIIKSQKPLPTDAKEGRHYHRAKIQITVVGSEDALYRWFDRVNVPDQLRIASQIHMFPNKPDDTKIDCIATVEQWFVPPAL
jgi:hypothetical protein